MSNPRDTLLDIEEVRRMNNVLWMSIVSIAIKWAPRETKKVLKEINENDRKISELWKCLYEQLPDLP